MGERIKQRLRLGGGDRRRARQQRTRFCSRSTPCFTPADARGKFAQDFAERRAGRFLLAERGKRLPEAQQRVGRLGGGFVFGRDVEEGFRRVTETLALEQAFAEPEGGVAGEPVARDICSESCGSRPRRARSPCAARSHRRGRIRRAASARAAAWRPPRRQYWDCEVTGPVRRPAAPCSRDRAGRPPRVHRGHRPARRRPQAATWVTTWVTKRRASVDRTQRVRRAGRVRILRRIKHIAAPAGRARRGRTRWLRRRVLRT